MSKSNYVFKGSSGWRGFGTNGTLTLGTGSVISLESGSEFWVVGRGLDVRYRSVSDAFTYELVEPVDVARYQNIPGVVLLPSSTLVKTREDAFVERVGAGGAVETIPAGTVINTFGVVGLGVPTGGGWVYVRLPSADSTYTDWWGMPEPPTPPVPPEPPTPPVLPPSQPCPSGKYKDAAGNCVNIPSTETGWSTGKKLLVGLGITALVIGTVWVASK